VGDETTETLSASSFALRSIAFSIECLRSAALVPGGTFEETNSASSRSTASWTFR
jgi:hypothetical protein